MVNLLCHEVNPSQESNQYYAISNLLSTAVSVMVGRSFGSIAVLVDTVLRHYGYGYT
jgi:hypothetical protein